MPKSRQVLAITKEVDIRETFGMKAGRIMALGIMCLAPVHARELVVAVSAEKPPFTLETPKGEAGIEVDILSQTLALAGHTVNIIILPPSRMLPCLARHRCDVAAASAGHDGHGFYYSEPFIRYRNVAVSKHARHLQLTSVRDLARYSFAIWQNGWRDLGTDFKHTYHPDAAGQFRWNYHETPSQQDQNRMFWANRVDLLIIDQTMFGWYRKRLSRSMDTSDPVDIHAVFGKDTCFDAIFRDPALRDDFNAGLATLQRNGGYRAILARYR